MNKRTAILLTAACLNLAIVLSGNAVAKRIDHSINENRRLYESAQVTESGDEFGSLLRQKDTPVLAYGTLYAKDPVTHPELDGQSFIDLHVEKKHWITTTDTDDDGNTTTSSDWERYDWNEWHCKELSFLGQDFSYSSLSGIPSDYYQNVDSWFGEYRDTYTGTTDGQVGTLFVSFEDDRIDKIRFYDKMPDEVVKDAGSQAGYIAFWIFVLFLLLGIDGFFMYKFLKAPTYKPHK